MSATKKPTVSEIRTRYSGRFAGQYGITYLLDLVKRMGKRLKPAPFSDCSCESCKEARALLKEIEL